MSDQYLNDQAIICSLKITEQKDRHYYMDVRHRNSQTSISFNPYTQELTFFDNNRLSTILIENIYQVRKILHNKRKKSFFTGFSLKFVLKNNKQVIDFNNTDKLIVLDKSQQPENSYPTDYYPPDCPVFYTDGSHQPKLQQSATAVILKKTNGKLSLYTSCRKETKSSQTELLAAIQAAKLGLHYHKYRIATDSRYVIKGLTEWIYNWKLNNWQTAQGTEVKNIEYWKEFDRLANNKFIEFRWIKGHSDQLENTLCDRYAKEAAARKHKLRVTDLKT
jgi:ribonuclease HI